MPEIELSQEEIQKAERAALDTSAIAQELVKRFAQPDEREEAAGRIHPATAHVFFIYAQVIDPYGDLNEEDFPPEACSVGREYFAVDPDEGIAILLDDLSEETAAALHEKLERADRDGRRRLLAG